MAKQFRRSLLAFYLPERPTKGDRGQDFRNLPQRRSDTNEAIVDALVRDIATRQDLVRAIIESDPDTAPLSFVGSMSMRDGVRSVADSICKTISFELTEFRAAPSAEAAFTLLRKKTEAVGVFVLLMGNLGSHHTALDVDAFRGFALADRFAPFIVINDLDARTAWSFTLLHELAHLWLGETGVSGSFSENRVERFCNDVASTLLLASDELDQIDRGTRDPDDLINAISNFALERNVSASFVAYRLYQMNRISEDAWRSLSGTLRDRWLKGRAEQRQKSRDAEGGPNYYIVRRHKVGPALIDFVRRNLGGGELTTVKAGRVLGVRPKNVLTLVEPAPR